MSSFLKFISHRSLLNCMWSDILWFNFCFHDTAPICISVETLRTSLFTAHVPPVLEAFLQDAIAKDPSSASLLEKSIHLWLSCGNVLELFKAHIQLAYRALVQKKKNQTSSILCVVRALGMKAAVKPHSSFPKWFSLPGVDSDFLTCDSIKFQNKVERKEMHIYWAKLKTFCRSIISLKTFKSGVI